MESPVTTPRKRKRLDGCTTDLAMKYFSEIDYTKCEYTIKNKTHICDLCGQQLNGKKEWNLSAHLSSCHPNVYFGITADKKEPIAVKRLKLLQNCTEIVSVNGRTFSHLQDSGFKSIIQKSLKELDDAKQSLNLSDHNMTVVKDHLSNTAEKLRKYIQNEVKDRPLSLLCDIVTKHNRSILGVSLQYSIDGQLKIRSIGMIELLQSHTGKYLAETIIERLGVFGISLKQILTITTDNGKNVLKMIRDMECCLNSEINQAKRNLTEAFVASVNDRAHAGDSNDSEIDSAINELLAVERDITDDEALDLVFAEAASECHETLLGEMSSELVNCGANVVWDIIGVNCSAHTLQLGIKDAMTKLDQKHSNVIQLCRQVCKFLRLKSTSIEMETIDISYRLPRLENDTRWGSMYLMVSVSTINIIYFQVGSRFQIYCSHFNAQFLSFVFQLYDILHCENIVKYYANEKKVKIFEYLIKKWITLKELVYILQIPYNTTVAFQKQKLTLSDVYGRWISMQLHLQHCKSRSSYKTGLADYLFEAMSIRSEKIFNNPLMSCALYLDPRFRSIVTQNSEKNERAKHDLMQIWRRLLELRGYNLTNEAVNNNTSNDNLSFEFDEEHAMELHLKPRNLNEAQQPTRTCDGNDIEMELELFQPEILPSKSSVLDFWESAKESNKQLYELAMVIFSIPPTEVQVERDFSNLDVVFTNRRGNLNQFRLEEIFLIHLNKDLFYKINSDDLKELYDQLGRAK